MVALGACKAEPRAPAPPPAVKTSPALPLGEKLDYEAKHRLPVRVTVERAFEALEAMQLPLTEKRQHVASPFLARYCAGALGPGGVAFSLCEFESGAAAHAGMLEAQAALSSIPHRVLIVNGESVLTIREPDPPTAASTETRSKAAAAFERL